MTSSYLTSHGEEDSCLIGDWQLNSSLMRVLTRGSLNTITNIPKILVAKHNRTWFHLEKLFNISVSQLSPWGYAKIWCAYLELDHHLGIKMWIFSGEWKGQHKDEEVILKNFILPFILELHFFKKDNVLRSYMYNFLKKQVKIDHSEIPTLHTQSSRDMSHPQRLLKTFIHYSVHIP